MLLSQKDLLEIITEVDTKHKYFGIIPLYPIYKLFKEKFNIPLDQFHSILLEMEKNQQIYLESINDITRLSIEEKKTAIYDQIRGYLFYVGLW